jgi:hypothetical protein
MQESLIDSQVEWVDRIRRLKPHRPIFLPALKGLSRWSLWVSNHAEVSL